MIAKKHLILKNILYYIHILIYINIFYFYLNIFDILFFFRVPFFYKIKKKINFLLHILNNYNQLIYSFIIRLFRLYNYHYCNSHFKNYLVNLIELIFTYFIKNNLYNLHHLFMCNHSNFNLNFIIFNFCSNIHLK